MTFHPRRFDSLSWPNAEHSAKRQGSTLVWPLGACEQHGPHLPLATDKIFSQKILEASLDGLAEELPIWFLPANAFGFSPEHASFPGTISLSANLLIDLVLEVGRQVSLMGFDRFLLFNAHGGQIGLLQAAARELRLRHPNTAVLPCFLWSGVQSLKELIPEAAQEGDLHAGFAETSLMLSLAPELIGKERINDGDHHSEDADLKPPDGWSLEGAAPFAWLTKDLSESGIIGDCRQANIDSGKALEKALTQHWTALLTNLMSSNWPLSTE